MSSRVLEHVAVRRQVTSISLEDYHRMLAAGTLPEETELFDGIVVDKMTKGADHNYFAGALADALRAIVPPNEIVLEEKTLTGGNSDVEPDIMVVPGPRSLYRTKNPSTARLVVEVAKSSLEYDRAKAAVYAAAGVPEYWIVNIEDRLVEIHEEPTEGEYSRQRSISITEPLRIFDATITIDGL